jgi:hypothetical protein
VKDEDEKALFISLIGNEYSALYYFLEQECKDVNFIVTLHHPSDGAGTPKLGRNPSSWLSGGRCLTNIDDPWTEWVKGECEQPSLSLLPI